MLSDRECLCSIDPGGFQDPQCAVFFECSSVEWYIADVIMNRNPRTLDFIRNDVMPFYNSIVIPKQMLIEANSVGMGMYEYARDILQLKVMGILRTSGNSVTAPTEKNYLKPYYKVGEQYIRTIWETVRDLGLLTVNETIEHYDVLQRQTQNYNPVAPKERASRKFADIGRHDDILTNMQNAVWYMYMVLRWHRKPLNNLNKHKKDIVSADKIWGNA